ncbi:porin, partial [Salmonella enterica subsp. enterica serovar Kentucky]|nr:porin [Salmonella enterica subsp. enterica serovar Kentucky]
GKDIEGVGSEDLVNYIDVGATYYFNKNMSAFVDYKINQLDSDSAYKIAGMLSRTCAGHTPHCT